MSNTISFIKFTKIREIGDCEGKNSKVFLAKDDQLGFIQLNSPMVDSFVDLERKDLLQYIEYLHKQAVMATHKNANPNSGIRLKLQKIYSFLEDIQIRTCPIAPKKTCKVITLYL